MVVDFEIKRTPGFRAVTTRWTGAWSDRRIRSEFEKLDRWCRERRLRTGNWYFYEPAERRWMVAIEVKGKARGEGATHIRSFPACDVAQVTFNPEEVSPRVIYHGLNDWIRWRRKDKTIRSVGAYRETYRGNPWKDRKAWGATTVQVVVKKK
jgi:hypothetical protein